MAKKQSRRSQRRSQRRSKGGENVPAERVEAQSEQGQPDAESIAPIGEVKAPVGGKRKTRKVSKGASDWNKKVMMVYHEMKKKNPAVKLGAAMKECSKRKKRGEL